MTHQDVGMLMMIVAFLNMVIAWILATRRGNRNERMIRALADHMRSWGQDEDGIPERAWVDYVAARDILGESVIERGE